MFDSHDNKFNVYIKYFNDNILPKYIKFYLPISWISIKSYKLCGKFNKESFDTHEYEKETFRPYFQGNFQNEICFRNSRLLRSSLFYKEAKLSVQCQKISLKNSAALISAFSYDPLNLRGVTWR